MKDYSCELGAACGPEAAAGRELAAVRKRRCVAEEAQVAGEGDELLLLLFVRAVVRDDSSLYQCKKDDQRVAARLAGEVAACKSHRQALSSSSRYR